MGSEKSLRYLISKYAILELVYTFFIILLFYAGINVLVNNGIVYPANHADKESEKIGSWFTSYQFSLEEIPFYYDFAYLENGEVLVNTMDRKCDGPFLEALSGGEARLDRFIGSTVFKSFVKGDKQLILSYNVNMIFTNESFYNALENFELAYIIASLIIWFLGFALLLIHSSNLVKIEIQKIASANEHINRMDLDYSRDYSEYREITGVLDSINLLAKNLKNSLNEQWDMQIKQKELVESITHDIRTPITLIKGNLELLKEENPDLSSERLKDISNGMLRLEKYIEKLKDFSYTMEGKKEIVTADVISYWIEILGGICRSNGFNLEIIGRDCSDISLDKEAIATALQNILINSTQNAEKGSVISLEFRDIADEFSVIIRDEGCGFDEALLPKLTEKFISGNMKGMDYKQGLGLSIVKKIVDANNGKLYLRNYSENSTGAEVKMLFTKEKHIKA